jgi:hypothetical protein
MKLPLEEIQKRNSVGMIAGGSGLTPMLQVLCLLCCDQSAHLS